jgi:hypothetical protein
VETLVQAMLLRYFMSANKIAEDLKVSGSTINNLFHLSGSYPKVKADYDSTMQKLWEMEKAGFKLKVLSEDREYSFIQKLYAAYKAGAITPEKFAEIQPGPDGTRSAW